MYPVRATRTFWFKVHEDLPYDYPTLVYVARFTLPLCAYPEISYETFIRFVSKLDHVWVIFFWSRWGIRKSHGKNLIGCRVRQLLNREKKATEKVLSRAGTVEINSMFSLSFW